MSTNRAYQFLDEPLFFDARVRSQCPRPRIRWTLGDGMSRTGGAFTHRYAAPGEYDVQVRATCDERCDGVARPVRVTVLDAAFTDLQGRALTEPLTIRTDVCAETKSFRLSVEPPQYADAFQIDGRDNAKVQGVTSLPGALEIAVTAAEVERGTGVITAVHPESGLERTMAVVIEQEERDELPKALREYIEDEVQILDALGPDDLDIVLRRYAVLDEIIRHAGSDPNIMAGERPEFTVQRYHAKMMTTGGSSDLFGNRYDVVVTALKALWNSQLVNTFAEFFAAMEIPVDSVTFVYNPDMDMLSLDTIEDRKKRTDKIRSYVQNKIGADYRREYTDLGKDLEVAWDIAFIARDAMALGITALPKLARLAKGCKAIDNLVDAGRAARRAGGSADSVAQSVDLGSIPAPRQRPDLDRAHIAEVKSRQAEPDEFDKMLDDIIERRGQPGESQFSLPREADQSILRGPGGRLDQLEAVTGLHHPDHLVLEAPWVGATSKSTSEGWKRDHRDFWTAFRDSFPESSRRLGLPQEGPVEAAPRVTREFAQEVGWQEYIGDRLVHHHLANEALTVPIPESVHRKLSAGIHRKSIIVNRP